jgi:hypothetical protein
LIPIHLVFSEIGFTLQAIPDCFILISHLAAIYIVRLDYLFIFYAIFINNFDKQKIYTYTFCYMNLVFFDNMSSGFDN